MKFKEQWVQEDVVCEHCGAITEPAKGLNKQNLKRLCFSKPTAQDIMMLFIWVSVLIIALSYNADVAQCREVINNFDSLCIRYMSQPISEDAGCIGALCEIGNLTNLELDINYETQEG